MHRYLTLGRAFLLLSVHHRVSGRALISWGPRNKKPSQRSSRDRLGDFVFDQFTNSRDFMTMTNLEPVARDKCEYLLAEFRAAALRARLWQADIDAVGLALKAGLISPDQAVEHLSDCGLLRLLGLREEQETAG